MPSSYEIDSKTYQFQGWYKGKTKPENLEKSVTPSYDITYDDNDDLTVVYKEIPQKNYTFEDVNGVEIAPPSDFIQDHQQPITTDGFRYLAGKNCHNNTALTVKLIYIKVGIKIKQNKRA